MFRNAFYLFICIFTFKNSVKPYTGSEGLLSVGPVQIVIINHFLGYDHLEPL